MNNVFVVSNDKKFYDRVKEHTKATYIKSDDLSLKTIKAIIKKKPSDQFFVVQDKYDIPLLDKFPFDFESEDDCVYRWNDKPGVMMFSLDAIKESPDEFTDEAMCNGKYKFKDESYGEFGLTTYPSYILTDDKEEARQFMLTHPKAKHLKGSKLTKTHLKKAIKNKDKFFYIVKGMQYFADGFDFNNVVEEQDESYVNAYSNDLNILLFNTDLVRSNLDDYTDKALATGKYALKFNKSVLNESPQFETTLYKLGKSKSGDGTCLHSYELSLHALNVIKRSCKTPFFYVVKEDTYTNIDLLGNVPNHVTALTFWNDDDSVRLFKSDKVFKNIKDYTDEQWFAGNIHDVNNIHDEKIEISEESTTARKEKYDLVLLAHGWPEWCEKMADTYGEIIHIDSFTLGLKQIAEILERCKSEYIYVVTNYVECKGTFNFNYKPPSYDYRYIHIWNDNDVIRMFNRKHLDENASYCTDQALLNNIAEVKNIRDDTVSFDSFDIIFMSYEEEEADINYRALKKRYPRAKRVDGVEGIFNAHKAASMIAGTHMFYVVDADAQIADDFDFSHYPNIYGRDCVYVWRSENPCNGLQYGWGGVKLFPTHRVRNADVWRVDFTTSIAKQFKAMPQVSNISAFNTDSFSSWRSGFREGAKLSSSIIEGANLNESKERLKTWTEIALPVPFAEEAREGAREGFEYGQTNLLHPDKLKLINDYKWLREQYENKSNME